ncbi:MAG: sulfatase-like hydrolase/transferase [Planctomycetales bacterium]|nr:sulfatase-like hydrolase/transferase [Planctomycetales bacterium]
MRFICQVAFVLPMAILAVVGRAEAKQPNVILIMADDLGYETIGANGGTSYATPHLDALAQSGMRFEHCYVQPLCTPTRVQLMTGLYNVRNYIRFGYMDPDSTTFGNLFQRAGYSTCIVGKWQLGQDPQLPKKFGFDEHCLWQHVRRPPRFANPGLEVNGEIRDYDDGEYGPDLVNDYALDFLERHKDKPFFLYYPMILTHDPYQPTPNSPDWDPRARGERVNRHVRHFGEMVSYMDKLVGRVVAKLEELNLRDNTLLIFLGDNGTGTGATTRMGERVVKGGKGSTKSTGMHVPLIANWPGHVQRGAVCPDLIASTDFLPTICEATGVAVPEGVAMDGRSFWKQLVGRAAQPRETIYCWYSRNGDAASVREFAFDQRYKLYRDGRFFDMQSDSDEQTSVAVDTLRGDAADAANRLRKTLDQYRDARPKSREAFESQAN